MRPRVSFLLFIVAAATVAPPPASPQTVGLAFRPDGTLYFSEVGVFQTFSCYVIVGSSTELASVAVRIETPPGIALLGAESHECADCNVLYDPPSQTVNIEFASCHAAGEPSVVARLMFMNLDHPWDDDTICIAEGDADYVSCDQQSGALQFSSDHACGPEPAPRCLYVNWLEPCGLPSSTESWGTVKARQSRPTG